MKSIQSFLFILLVTTVFAQSPISLIPQPVSVQPQRGVFALNKSTTIQYNRAEARAVADMLSQQLNIPTAFGLSAKEGKSGKIQLNLTATSNPQLGEEGYTLDASSKAVVITANRPAGLFYGIQTLTQLLPKEIGSKKAVAASWSLPAVKITDYPRFGWRGIMLDVSRNFFTKAEVKQYIDQLAKLKYNTFHWHLTDDNGWRIEIKSLPKLTEVGAWRAPRAGHFGDRADPKPGEPAT